MSENRPISETELIDMGGLHFLGTKGVIDYESSPNADAALVCNASSECIHSEYMTKLWRTRLNATTAILDGPHFLKESNEVRVS